MANTTYFGWETPDDTDLVKDGAAAIRTLGQAIDTSMQDLEGGTTGQILSKNSNADMDFVWITNDVGDITEVVAGTGLSGGGSSGSVTLTNTVATEFDAKGDLVVGTGADTFDKLSAGTNNHRLIAASGETTGLKYVADTQNTVIDAEGDLLVGDAADAVQRLAVGTTGQVLTVDTAVDGKIKWATASAGGMTLINTGGTTLTGSSVTISDIPSTYESLILKVYQFSGSADGNTIRIRYNGDDNANRYRSVNSNEGPDTYAWNATSGDFGANQDDAATSRDFHNLQIYNYVSTTSWKVADITAIGNWFLSSTDPGFSRATIVYNQTTAISSITLFPNSGTFDSGTAFLYGVK